MEFLQSYGALALIALLFGLMLWRSARRHGAGCCGGGHKYEHETVRKDARRGQNGSCH